jgi:hypothetical protein
LLKQAAGCGPKTDALKRLGKFPDWRAASRLQLAGIGDVLEHDPEKREAVFLATNS